MHRSLRRRAQRAEETYSRSPFELRLIEPKRPLVRFLGKCHLASSRRFKRCLVSCWAALGGTCRRPAATATASDDETTASIILLTEAHLMRPRSRPGLNNSRGTQRRRSLLNEDVNLNLRYHLMTTGSGNDHWEASLECDGGSGGCEDPRAGFGVTQEEAEEAAIAAARKSSWREVDGRWLCPLCYWRVCYWQAISTAKPAHSQQRADSSLRPGQKQRIAVRAMQPIL